jgi:hypothetical protein
MIAWMLWMACAGRAEPAAGTAPAVAVDEASPTPLHGARPSAPVAVPDFRALNSDGAPRDRTALLGHPTVLWFYPMAGTPG